MDAYGRLRIRLEELRVDSVVDYPESCTQRIRVAIALEVGRRQPAISRYQGMQQMSVLDTEAFHVFERPGRKLRIKIGVSTGGPIVVLRIDKQRHVWKDILDKKGFSPSRVSADQVGDETLLLEFLQGTGD